MNPYQELLERGLSPPLDQSLTRATPCGEAPHRGISLLYRNHFTSFVALKGMICPHSISRRFPFWLQSSRWNHDRRCQINEAILAERYSDEIRKCLCNLRSTHRTSAASVTHAFWQN